MNREIDAARELADTAKERTEAQVTASAQFERVRDLLATIDIPTLWAASTGATSTNYHEHQARCEIIMR